MHGSHRAELIEKTIDLLVRRLPLRAEAEGLID
jgi:hypothetical protein